MSRALLHNAHRDFIPQTKDNASIFIDISEICDNDASTGIQRVVRSIANILAKDGHKYNMNIVFVYIKKGAFFRVEIGNEFIKTDIFEHPSYGDIFLGLDFSLDLIWRNRAFLKRVRKRGVRIWFLVHDVLPFTHRHWFSRPTVERFHNWLSVISVLSDGFLCVSADTAAQLSTALNDRFRLSREVQMHVIPMGWDVHASKPSMGVPRGFDDFLERLGRAKTILMVGTVEPRKGHADALKAMNILWERGQSYNLVIVGAAGWHTEDLQETIMQMSASSRYLHWLQGLSDEALIRLYDVADGVLMASYAEGFGLPMIEALGHRKSILARRIKAFEVYAEKSVAYFPFAASPEELAQAIEDWMETAPNIAPPLHLSTWQDTADFIGSLLLQPKDGEVGTSINPLI